MSSAAALPSKSEATVYGVETMGVGLMSGASNWRRARPALAVAVAVSLAAMGTAGASAGSAVASAGSAVASAGGPKVAAKDRFAGRIVSGTGSFAGDHGSVVILLARGRTTTSPSLTVTLRGRTCAGTDHCLRLSGTVAGTISERQTIPDVGRTFTIGASGTVGPLGATSVHGIGHGTGFILDGHEQLQLRLSAAGGTVSIAAQTGRVPGFTSP
jgi:hypothetical protein